MLQHGAGLSRLHDCMDGDDHNTLLLHVSQLRARQCDKDVRDQQCQTKDFRRHCPAKDT